MGITVDVAYKSLNKYTEILCGDKVELLQTADSNIMILADGMGSGVKANILGAETKNVNGQAFGYMLLGLPDSSIDYSRALSYIRSRDGVSAEEVPDYAV